MSEKNDEIDWLMKNQNIETACEYKTRVKGNLNGTQKNT